MILHSLFQSKMADSGDFLNGDVLEAILDILEADQEMEEEFKWRWKCKYEEHYYNLLFWRKRAENVMETRTFEYERLR